MKPLIADHVQCTETCFSAQFHPRCLSSLLSFSIHIQTSPTCLLVLWTFCFCWLLGQRKPRDARLIGRYDFCTRCCTSGSIKDRPSTPNPRFTIRTFATACLILLRCLSPSPSPLLLSPSLSTASIVRSHRQARAATSLSWFRSDRPTHFLPLHIPRPPTLQTTSPPTRHTHTHTCV